MPPNIVRFTGLTALLCAMLAATAYFVALNSDHAATNGDELLYAQMTYATAKSSHWLPLQTMIERHRNTKPPGLFWQGLVSTDWAKSYTLWNLRWPNVLYTLGTALMVFALARKASASASLGLLAALIYLSFFGTYRYGRVFLTSAPETFWLFAPFFALLFWRPRAGGLTWPMTFAFGLMTGFALLYKSFALVLPAAVGFSWWTLHLRGYGWREWLRSDLPKIALLGVIALGVFSLWFALDPQRHLILQDFVLRENAGKFDTGGRSYFVNLLWGESSIWRSVISYPLNAGLLAPAIVALFVVSWRHRRDLGDSEKLLWIWVAAVFAVFTLPNQRDERYLLPAMPALAVLAALRWSQIPRWVLAISLLAVAVIASGMALGAIILTSDAGVGPLYPWFYWIFISAVVGFAVIGMIRGALTHAFVCPAILLLYLCYAAFLIPFDGPRGEFDQAAKDFARGKSYAAPINFNAREEIYRFMLPGSDPRPYHVNDFTFDEIRANNSVFIVTLPLSDMTVENSPGLRVIGTRLQVIDRFNNKETMDMLTGNISRNLFKKDLLVEAVNP
ncbi:MAG: phospholipid carrier-dependent glycosyltransferase [Chthoniobacterales bacterium]|nr:phospholipid carrier-dependent glycosyltransferase [Chthoniobacterales bacterium]